MAVPVTKPESKAAEEGPVKSSYLVAAGILLSRISGLVRERVFAHYFGTSAAADAFKAAIRIPNYLQNLFGEGVLSASFIPVYAGLRAREKEEEAERVALTVFTILVLTTTVLVLVGVLAAPIFIFAIAPGFDPSKKELTIRLVRILFPGVGLLVFSAWCLGILNSHRKFFISYAAPVAFNAAMVGVLLVAGRRADPDHLASITAWGAVGGSALQVAVQLPIVIRLIHGLGLSFSFALESVRTVIRNFVPVFISRGVIQISAYIDSVLASFLGTGAVTALSYAQTLYTLPVSLFGMAVSAAELPVMSSAVGDTEEIAAYLRGRLDSGLRQIAFFIVPSGMAFLALGDVVSAGIYQSGEFHQDDSIYVWGILAGSTVGLLASTLGRLYSSTYYALKDTRTPLKFAIVRVVLTTVLGYLAAIHLPGVIGIPLRWGAVGLTASAGIAGWVEFVLLRTSLNRRIGRTGLPGIYVAKLWIAATVGAGIGWGIKLGLGQRHPIIMAVLILGPYGITYFGVAHLLGLSEARSVVGRVTRLLRRR